MNPNRREVSSCSLERKTACFERIRIPIGLQEITQDQLNDIVANAQSREEFHDCNWHASEDGGWAVCLCEIRIITGTECIRHLSEGECMTPGHLPKISIGHG